MYQKTSNKVYIDQSMVGFIIGKKGCNIKRLQNQSGAFIKIISKNVSKPYAQISGSKIEVNKATALINDLLHRDLKKTLFQCRYDNIFSLQLAQSYQSKVSVNRFKDQKNTRRPNQVQFYLKKKDNQYSLEDDFKSMNFNNNSDYELEKNKLLDIFVNNIQDNKNELAVYILFGKFLFYEKYDNFIESKYQINILKTELNKKNEIGFYYHNLFFCNKQSFLSKLEKYINQEEKKEEKRLTLIIKSNKLNKMITIKLQKCEDNFYNYDDDQNLIEINNIQYKINESTDDKQRLHLINFYNNENQMDQRLYLISNKKAQNLNVQEVIKNFEINFNKKIVKCLNNNYEIDEYRFIDRELYDIKDSEFQLLIDNINCLSQPEHFQVELHDKQISSVFFQKNFTRHELEEKVQDLVGISEELVKLYSFIK